MVVMNIANKNIELLDFSELEGLQSFTISNCTIATINFDLFEPNFHIKIEDCKIENFSVHSCWFKGGLLFRNNEVKNYIDYQMGGHNELPIILDGNIFNSFVNFFDCQFYNYLEVTNNTFIKGSNLLGNLEEGFKNTFNKDLIFKNNIGNIDIDGFGL
jgi:hypothetical protein